MLEYDLSSRRWGRPVFTFHRQEPILIEYNGIIIADAFRADLIVENSLIVEINSVEQLAPVHGKPRLTYLQLTKQPRGLLLNFGAATFRKGVKSRQQSHQLRVFACTKTDPAPSCETPFSRVARFVTKAQRKPPFGPRRSRVGQAAPRPNLVQISAFAFTASITPEQKTLIFQSVNKVCFQTIR
jgi:GxxExxY protein